MDMDRGVRGWIMNTTKLNFWRVAGWYEFDDLVQDGFLHYQRIVTKYSHVKEPKQMMSLFQRAFTNHIHDLAKKRTRDSVEVCEHALGIALENIATPMYANPDTNELIAQMPSLLRKLVSSQTDARLRRPCRRKPDHRETTNERMCRIVGADPRAINLLDSLREYLSTGLPLAV